MEREFKHIKPPEEFLNESRRPIEAHKVSKQNKDIKIFKNKMDFNVPVSDENHISVKPGTTFVCIENNVFVKNEKEDTYTKALFETKFIEINKKIFQEEI
jgi:hypothetical protein